MSKNKIKYYITTAIPKDQVSLWLNGEDSKTYQFPLLDAEESDELHDIGTIILTEEEYKQVLDVFSKIRLDRKVQKKIAKLTEFSDDNSNEGA